MNELRCNCGGRLYTMIYFDSDSRAAEKYRPGFRDYSQVVSLTCYDCGEIFGICRAPSDADVSEIKGIYDFNDVDAAAYDIHQQYLEANRSCFEL